VNRLDSVSLEVIGIEFQNPRDTVHIHRSCQFCIMNLAAHNGALYHQPFPFPINSRGIRQDNQKLLDFFNSPSARAIEKPRPLFATGRVATFQNSEMFWSVK
jgi:hypothetical protein